MIYYFTPYSLEKNLAKVYNHYCQLVNDDDWICLLDGDICFLIDDWGHYIQEVINVNPQIDLFTCFTNRIGNKQQRIPAVETICDMVHHIQIAKALRENHGTNVRELYKVISGHFMLFKKSTWQEVGGFNEERKILTVDNNFSHRVLKHGKKIGIIKGLYVFHKYRMGKDIKDTSHLL